MAGKVLALTAFLWMLTACRQEQLSLPIAHAAGSEPNPAVEIPLSRQDLYQPAPGESCYSFILLRPKNQRAVAVQARLKQADKMAAALDSPAISVDLVGDHANILSLQFPTVWPAPPSYTERLSSIVEDYFSAEEVEDYLCNSGFDQVKLSARGLNDRRIHPIWTARVTSEGLLKIMPSNFETN